MGRSLRVARCDRQLHLTTKNIFEMVNEKIEVSLSTVRRALIKLKTIGIFAIESSYQVTIQYLYGINQLKEQTTENIDSFKNEQENSELSNRCSKKITKVQKRN